MSPIGADAILRERGLELAAGDKTLLSFEYRFSGSMWCFLCADEEDRDERSGTEPKMFLAEPELELLVMMLDRECLCVMERLGAPCCW